LPPESEPKGKTVIPLNRSAKRALAKAKAALDRASGPLPTINLDEDSLSLFSDGLAQIAEYRGHLAFLIKRAGRERGKVIKGNYRIRIKEAVLEPSD
jgi:hypothetical protein